MPCPPRTSPLRGRPAAGMEQASDDPLRRGATPPRPYGYQYLMPPAGGSAAMLRKPPPEVRSRYAAGERTRRRPGDEAGAHVAAVLIMSSCFPSRPVTWGAPGERAWLMLFRRGA